MAEVYGDLGGQPIELNNAATESTLRELVAAMGILSAKMGGKKGPAEIEKEMKKFQEQINKATKSSKEGTKAAEEEVKAKKESVKAEEEATKKKLDNAKAVNQVTLGIRKFGDAAAGVVKNMTDMLSSVANVGNSMTAAAATMNSIPIVGGVLAGVFGAVADSAEKTHKAFQQTASIGATFSGSISNMVNSASAAGLTMDQFAGIIQKNGQALTYLGGTTENGAKIFSQLGKEIKNSQVGNELLRMGYSTEQVNNGMAGYIGIMGKTGALQNMSTKQIAASSAGYLKDLDALAKITGESREEKQKEQEALMKDAQVRAAMAGMDAEQQKQMMAYITSFPKEQQSAIKDMIATGNITSEEAIKLNAMMPGAAQQAMAFGKTLQEGGQISKESFNAAKNNAIKEAGVRVKEMKDQGLYNQEMASTYVGMADLAAQKIDGVNQAYEEQAKSVEKANQAEQIEKFKQQLAETSNSFMLFLSTSGLIEKLQSAFTMLTDFMMNTVVPGFQWLSDNFDMVATVVGVAIAAYVALEAIIMAASVVQALQTLGITASLAPLAAMAAAAWAVVAPILAVAAPFIAVGVAIVAVIAGLRALYKAGWDLGTIFDAVKDNLYSTFVLGFKELFIAIRSFLPQKLGGYSAEQEEEARKNLQLERDQLKANEAARDAKRAEKRELRGIKEEEKVEEKKKVKAAGAAAVADNEKAAAARDAAVEEKKKAEGYGGVGQGDPLKDLALYNKKRAEAAAGGAAGAAGTAGAGATAGTPPPLNQDQKKNMELVEAALKKQGITDPKMIAATKANVMKETGGKAVEENLNYGKTSNERVRSIFGSRAAGKTDAELDDIKKDPSKMGEMMYGKDTKIGASMGNTEAGDGFKYRGRGFVQLTGKNNYAAASKAIYGDDRLVKNPDMVNDPQVAADVSAWFMKRGSAGMAKQLGVDTNNMTQEQANLVATSTVAGRAIKPGEGYLGGEVMDKVNKYSTAFASGQQPLDASGRATATTDARIAGRGAPTTTATPATPTTATAQAATTSAGTQMVMVGNKSYVKDSPEHKAALAAEEAKKAGTTAPTTTPGGGEKPQESAETLLAKLNMQVGELIAVTKDSKRVNERQLGVMAENSGNMYAIGA